MKKKFKDSFSFSPFLNFFMVKYSDGNWLENIGFSPFLNFFMVKYC
ncbi:hypothetical protein JRQ04_001205 [Campylobacter jejuni]|nr:hypothetical protein [Campylobacter jejuni]